MNGGSNSQYQHSQNYYPATHLNTQNRLMYDKCAYAHKLYESTSPLAYMINPIAYESCNKCFQAYPGFIGALGGFGFGVGPREIDVESDLRNQTRLNTLCPAFKYIPECGCKTGKYPTCPGCNQGLPCGCPQCKSRNVNALKDCAPGIIPLESMDTRQIKPCNNLSGIHINRFDFLCENPQDPSRIFFYRDNNRLGRNTYLEEIDAHTNTINKSFINMNTPNTAPCKSGGMGCASIADSMHGVLF